MLNMFIAIVIGLAIAGVIIWNDSQPIDECINSFDDDDWN